MNEEHENETAKRVRGRSRARSLTLSKRNRHRKRSGSEDNIKLGNGRTVKFCSFCRPTLAKRVTNKEFLLATFKDDLKDFKNKKGKEFKNDSRRNLKSRCPVNSGSYWSDCHLYQHITSKSTLFNE
jgi:hypothetical protein